MNKALMQKAKLTIGTYCKVCPVCNGVACKGVIPGPGGKGTGIGFVRNYEDLKKYALNMDTLSEVSEVNTEMDFFGERVSAPIFAGPIGAVQLHYSDLYNDLTYSRTVLEGCVQEGVLAFTGDGVNDQVFIDTAKAIAGLGGKGVPTIKPWNESFISEKMKLANEAQAVAIAMDIDAAGLPILAGADKKVSPKSVEALKRIVSMTDRPIILKGIMTAKGAQKALEAGAKGIIVSNHGGRVLDETPSTISVLEEIADVVGDQMMILVDGGFRSGIDVFKALALGAHGVVIARPFVTAAYGGGVEGVATLVADYRNELKNAMLMTGCADISEIHKKHIRFIG